MHHILAYVWVAYWRFIIIKHLIQLSFEWYVEFSLNNLLITDYWL